jgi:superfamily II DNA or RNA helicase
MATLSTTKEVGNVFERFVQVYLQTAPVYQSLLKMVWLLDEAPTKLVSKLNLQQRDQGIDLIAETFNGEFWAVQAKYRKDTQSSISWDELSTFAGLMYVSKGFAFGLVCTSTEQITSVLQGNVGCVANDTWMHLDNEYFRLMKRQLMALPVRLQAMSPRPHQTRAIKKGVAHFMEHNRGKLISPCASGKSLIAYWLTQSLKPKLTLVAVPSIALIKQTLDVWLREAVATGQAVDWRCVCSDESAGNVDNDDLVMHAYELGVPTTDATKIAQWLAADGTTRRVLFTTYQSGPVVAKAAKKARMDFDFGVFDEAHKTVGATKSLFSYLLFDKNINIKKRLFMTATERFYTGDSDKIASMDNEELYGTVFETLSFKEAMEQGILCGYEVLIMGVSSQEVVDLLENNAYVNPGSDWKDIDTRTLANLIALRKVIEKFGVKHTVSFHKSIVRASNFQRCQDTFNKTMPKFGSLYSTHVSGKMSASVRNRLLSEFIDHEPSLITNAKCLTEGVDVPGIDCVMFADARSSKIDIVQASGRAMRQAPGKKKGYIVVPLFVPADEEIGLEQMESSAFKEVFTVLRALAANDQRIVEYFKAITSGGVHSGTAVRFLVDEVLPVDISLDKFVRAFEVRCFEKLDRLNQLPFEEARELARELKLTSSKEWIEYSKSDKRLLNIPSRPDVTYKDNGWVGWGDWLGYVENGPWLPFVEAREFARSLKLTSSEKWKGYAVSGKRPFDIPSRPDVAYSGWAGYADWLGYVEKKRVVVSNRRRPITSLRPFEETREFARGLKLTSRKEWQRYSKSDKRPFDVPSCPNITFKDQGWNGWADWLGYVADWRSFEEAREFVRGLKITNLEEWRKYAVSDQRPSDIPSRPDSVYKDSGWVGWADWLGTVRDWLSFEEAREFALGLKIKSGREWKKQILPAGFPRVPEEAYLNEWVSWPDFLGTDNHHRRKAQCRSFEEAREFARSLNLSGHEEWKKQIKTLPLDIPKAPNWMYSDEWNGWADWLGTVRDWRPFREVQEFARGLNIKSMREWKKQTLPIDIPYCPQKVYADEWNGWPDFLGTEKAWRSFDEAREFAHSLKLRSNTEWREYCRSGKRPLDIPANPDTVYSDEWVSWPDFLGTVRGKAGSQRR